MFFFSQSTKKETNNISLVAQYHTKRINLNSFRRKSLNHFFYNITTNNQGAEFSFASILLVNPDYLRFLDFLIYSFNLQSKNCNSVYINFISKKLQNFFLVPSSSNTFLISATNKFYNFFYIKRVVLIIENYF